ncbi:MAG: hypothetical protein A2293_00520 [Elusimicrobia bacterium RIFOXYB2_FULL_49_7]|nr:MAG: hypothetical protein A2293_00520 [Elusimicrobia bacterium RIFOXYB2_FULL_49_7]
MKENRSSPPSDKPGPTPSPAKNPFFLKLVTILLFLFLLFQAYHKRHWFRHIPNKAPVKFTEKSTTAAPPLSVSSNKAGAKKGLLSLFRSEEKKKQGDIALLNDRLDSLFREFNIQKIVPKRKPKTFPRMVTEEQISLPRGKPLPEYTLAISRAVVASGFIIADCIENNRDTSVVLEIARGTEGVRKMTLGYGARFQTGYARIAVVIEGFGLILDNNVHTFFSSVRLPLTLGIIPLTRYAESIADLARANGWELIGQIPMESFPYRYLGGNAIYKHFNATQVEKLLSACDENLPALAGYAIFGNGVRIVENEPDILRFVLQFAKIRKRYFLDNSFAQHSRVADIAAGLNVPLFAPLVQPDRFSNPESRHTALVNQINQIRRTGSGLLLLQTGDDLLSTLEEARRLIEKYDIKPVTLSTLLL